MTTPDTSSPAPSRGPNPITDGLLRDPGFRRLYWSVRREFWEHRATYMAPAIAAGVVFIGFLLGSGSFAHHLTVSMDGSVEGEAERHKLMVAPYAVAAASAIVVGLIVAITFCAGALYNERRDRSLLFWKSLPVSDLTTVLSKAAVPILIMPWIVLGVTLVVTVAMGLVGSAVTLAMGQSLQDLWSHLPLGFMWLCLAYGLPYVALWQAPVFAWFILVSAWAKRVPMLWALGVPFALSIVERMASDTHVIGHAVWIAIVGGYGEAFSVGGDGEAPIQTLADIDIARMLAQPHLWIGLAVAGGFLYLASRLRRSAVTL